MAAVRTRELLVSCSRLSVWEGWGARGVGVGGVSGGFNFELLAAVDLTSKRAAWSDWLHSVGRKWWGCLWKPDTRPNADVTDAAGHGMQRAGETLASPVHRVGLNVGNGEE